jgi:DNA polymerase V
MFYAETMSAILFLTNLVPCGFPSPAADSREESLDLQSYLIAHPASTCCVRCSGDSMSGAMIADGDILVVDRQVQPVDGDIVLAMYDGSFLVKRFYRRGSYVILHSENPSYRDVKVAEGCDFVVCGVVTAVVRKLRNVGNNSM